jgi:PKD repeat protein
MVTLIALAMGLLILAATAKSANSTTVINYGDLTLTPPGVWTVMATHWNDVWDLTKGDLTLSYTIDMTGVTQPAVWDTSYTEVGLRTEGAGDFNPGPFGVYQGGCGGWMTSLYGDLTPSPGALSLFDKHNLGASGGEGEGDYDCLVPTAVVAPFGSGNNHGIWFDRDTVDPWQDDDPLTPPPGGSAVPWGSHNGQTYNTGGIYQIVIQYHAINPNLGSMFATVNGQPTGFYTPAYHAGVPDYYPAGLSFKGDMTRMQVFAGIIAPDSSTLYGFTVIHNLTVTGELGVSSPLVADFTYSPAIVVKGDTVHFTDTSHGGYLPISAWSWDLNGDSVADSTAQNPSYVYTTAGDYNVELEVTGYCPYCGSATVTITIHVYATYPVGGEWVPINTVQMLAQLITSVLAMVAVAASFVGFKHIKRKRN